MKGVIIALLTGLVICTTTVNVQAQELVKGQATVYSLQGKTKLGTQTRYGVVASGNKELLGKTVIVYQRLPGDKIGDCLGIYTVEDTGCKKEVIDIWCPVELQQKIIDKTYENGCKGKIYIQIVEV